MATSAAITPRCSSTPRIHRTRRRCAARSKWRGKTGRGDCSRRSGSSRLGRPVFAAEDGMSVMAVLFSILAATSTPAAYDPELTSYEYPFPVSFYELTSQRQKLRMAYLDVKPSQPNGRTVLLFHGKNFSAAYWEPTIRSLTA